MIAKRDNWLIEQGLTSHQIGTIFTGHMTKPTVSKHWRKPVGLSDKAWIPSGPLHHVTIIQL